MFNDFTDEIKSTTDVEYILCETQLITTSLPDPAVQLILNIVCYHCL